jgi:hypothetical protein
MDYQYEMIVIDRFDIRVFLKGPTMVMQSFAGTGASYVEEDPNRLLLACAMVFWLWRESHWQTPLSCRGRRAMGAALRPVCSWKARFGKRRRAR